MLKGGPTEASSTLRLVLLGCSKELEECERSIAYRSGNRLVHDRVRLALVRMEIEECIKIITVLHTVHQHSCQLHICRIHSFLCTAIAHGFLREILS